MSEGCSAVKRFGESCPKNNNCTYPQCLIDEKKTMSKAREEFKRDTGYSIDKSNKSTATYLHFNEEITEGEYYRKYTEWLESRCAILIDEDSEYIYSFMPEWVKEQPEGLDPTFYGTGSSGGDRQVKERIKQLLKQGQ